MERDDTIDFWSLFYILGSGFFSLMGQSTLLGLWFALPFTLVLIGPGIIDTIKEEWWKE